MHRIRKFLVCVARVGVVLVGLLLLASCSMLIDELRIRVDPNTIVKPDVHELRALEIADGTYIESESSISQSYAVGSKSEALGMEAENPFSRQAGYGGGRGDYTPIVPSARSAPMPSRTYPMGEAGPVPQAQYPGQDAPSARSVPPWASSGPPATPVPPSPPSLDPAVIEELR